MAVPLLRRAFLQRQSSNLYYFLFNYNSRLFSSNKDENGNDSAAVEHKLSQQNTSEISSKDSPVAAMSPSEGAVEKFFKVVRKVEESQTKAQQPDLVEQETLVAEQDSNEPFATMLRKCKLISLGDIQNKVVEGKVIEVMDDDLYIDFGGKFHCVCPRPKRNPGHYYRGTKVLVNLQAMEMSSAFLGSDIHVTLLEADGTLLGLANFKSQRESTARK